MDSKPQQHWFGILVGTPHLLGGSWGPADMKPLGTPTHTKTSHDSLLCLCCVDDDAHLPLTEK